MSTNGVEYLRSLIDRHVNEQLERVMDCNQHIESVLSKFDSPVSVLVTVACDGRLAYYVEEDTSGEHFIERALEQSATSGIHLIGYFRAEMNMGDWFPFTQEDQLAAIEVYSANKMNELIDYLLLSEE